MKRFHTLFLSFLLTLTLVVSAAAPALAAPAEEDRAAAALAAATAAMEYGGATSVQYALWQDGEITISGSAGVYSKTENRLLTDDILYGIGSISKTFTAAAMMKLVEQGKVDLDQPVTTYLPDFKMADPRYRDITVRMLLNHSSGLMGGTTVNGFLLNDPTESDATANLLQRLSTQTLQAAPGAYSVYSNDSFTLAELVIERVSGMSYTEFIHQYLISPLGLSNVKTPRDSFDQAQLAKAYLASTETRALPAETVAIIGTGGIYASAGDLARFGGAFCNDSLLTQSSRNAMANNESLRGMWPEGSEGDALAYGLGWDSVNMFPFNQSGIQALVKGGDTLAYHAGLVVLPEYNMAAAVLSSGGISTYNEAAAAQMLIDALKEQGVQVDESAVLNEVAPASMPRSLTARSGYYGTSTAVVHVQVDGNGTLTLTIPASLGGGSQQFTYCADGSFRNESNSVLIKLMEEENGQVYLFQKGYTQLPGIAPLCTASYGYERLPEHKISEETRAAWASYSNTFYVLVNEKYSSGLYPFGATFAAVGLSDTEPGYMLSYQLQDAHTAVPFVQIPGTGSRDSSVITIAEQNGIDYLSMSGSLYQDAADVSPIYAGNAKCTIQENGYARWYQTGEAAGSTMTVTLPQSSGFHVYDANLQLVASSWAYGDTSVTLPENGWIVFAGDAGDTFSIQMAA